MRLTLFAPLALVLAASPALAADPVHTVLAVRPMGGPYVQYVWGAALRRGLRDPTA